MHQLEHYQMNFDTLEDDFINPTDIPKGTKLRRFIQVQGTRLIFKSLENLIDKERFKVIHSGEIPVHRFVMVPDIDNMSYMTKNHDTLTHYCKVPQKTNFHQDPLLKPDCQHQHDFKCSLRKVMNLGIFIKKVNAYANLNPNIKKQDTVEYAIYQDLLQKSMMKWDDKDVFHHCVFDHHTNVLECDCNGGLGHWDILDIIRNDTELLDTSKKRYQTSLTDGSYDPHSFIPWRNLNGDLIFEDKISSGNCIDAVVKIGTLRVESFNDVVGLNVEFAWLYIDNIFYCPMSSPSQGPHICHKIMCDTFLRGGFTVCALSGITLVDKNFDWSINTKVTKKGSYEQSIKRDIYDCKKVFTSKPRHVNTGVSKNDLMDVDSELSISVFNEFKTVEQLKKFHENNRDRATNRTQQDKERREILKSKIMSEGTEKAIKMAKSGHFSNYLEYKKEAFIAVKKILCYGNSPLRAMLINMERMFNVVRRLEHKDSSSNRDKITLEISNHPMPRGSILPSNYKRIEYKPSSSSSSSSAVILYQKEDRNDDCIISLESKTFNIQKYIIDKNDVEQNINDEIQRLAEASIRFWALIRTRTRLGRENPNVFNFNHFVYAFLYLERDGYIINTGFAGAGDNIVFFEKNLFLKGALPPKMDDLKKLKIVSNAKRDVNYVYDRIKDAINETIVEEKRSFVDLHPYKNEKLDFSIDSKEFPPSLFISLQIKRVMK